MKKFLPFAIAMLFAGTAQAGRFNACDIESDYDLTIGKEALTFVRDAGTPERIVMHDGRLTIDGAEQALSAADTARIAKYERDIRAMVPEIKAIAIDAVGIATDAVVQVAKAFAGNTEPRSLARLEEIGARVSERIEASDTTSEWREHEFDAAIEELTAELVPMVVGDIAAVAVAAALSGDEEKLAQIEARADALEKEVEARVEARADVIEERAEALCPRMAALDALESEMELRLADGSPLDLVQMKAK